MNEVVEAGVLSPIVDRLWDAIARYVDVEGRSMALMVAAKAFDQVLDADCSGCRMSSCSEHRRNGGHVAL